MSQKQFFRIREYRPACIGYVYHLPYKVLDMMLGSPGSDQGPVIDLKSTERNMEW